MLRDHPLLKKMIETGEDRMSKLASNLLSNEKVMGAIQKTVGAALEAKGLAERSVRNALSTMNIPTAGDVKKLESKIDELEKVFETLTEKVSTLQREKAPVGESRDRVEPQA
jgi:polyhydroxyalkanoate synthesis regulator phasin